MKDIRHIYRFHFHGKCMNTVVEIKAQTLKDLYYKLLTYEPALEHLSNYAANCSLVRVHKRRSIPVWKCHNHFRGFLPHEVMSEKDYNRVLNGK